MIYLPNAVASHRTWETARPFPHVVIERAVYADDAAALAAEFPPPDDPGWHTFSGRLEHGKQEGAATIAGPLVAALHDEFASDMFVGWLRVVSGIPDLIADPHRHGGGIHQSGDRARLGVHVDFDLHPRMPGFVRAVNTILFVGDHDHWDTDWGGMLELGAGRDVAVEPLPGLLVAFEASGHGWHGHPTPMTEAAPLRRSVPAYYYRPLGPGEVAEGRSTRFLVLEGPTT